MSDDRGLIHIYYGDGKGKTTAAFGLAFRCAGHGARVVVAQFLKNGKSGEVAAAAALPQITVLSMPGPVKFSFRMNEEEKAAAAGDCRELLRRAMALAREKQAGLLVLDEVLDVCAKFCGTAELCAALDGKDPALEVVLTGHSLPPELAERAHYISHIVKEKHPFDRGVRARKSIEF